MRERKVPTRTQGEVDRSRTTGHWSQFSSPSDGNVVGTCRPSHRPPMPRWSYLTDRRRHTPKPEARWYRRMMELLHLHRPSKAHIASMRPMWAYFVPSLRSCLWFMSPFPINAPRIRMTQSRFPGPARIRGHRSPPKQPSTSTKTPETPRSAGTPRRHQDIVFFFFWFRVQVRLVVSTG